MTSGPPKVTCSVCGQEVLKAQTRHVGEGKRACKSHEGIETAAENAHKQIQQQHAQHREQRDKRHKEHTPPMLQRGLTCLVCGLPAVQVSEMLQEAMIVSKEIELETGNPASFLLNPQAVAERVKAKFDGRVPLYHYGREELEPAVWDRVRRRLPSWRKQVLDLLQMAPVCVHCCSELGIPDKLERQKTPSLETLHVLSVIGKPVLDRVTNIARGRRVLKIQEN